MVHGKKYRESITKINKGHLYDVSESIKVVKEVAYAKFDETVELHVKLGVDSRHADQQVRGAVVLPNGTGKQVRVLVIAGTDKFEEAKQAGADVVGGEELIAKIQSENWFDFDVIVSTPDMMSGIGRLGRVLGPKGLMPNPKAGTVTTEVGKAVKDIKAGKIEYRLDKNNIIHCPIGKVSFSQTDLDTNLRSLMGAIMKAKPAAAKGQYIRSITLCSTMGPGIHVNPASA